MAQRPGVHRWFSCYSYFGFCFLTLIWFSYSIRTSISDLIISYLTIVYIILICYLASPIRYQYIPTYLHTKSCTRGQTLIPILIRGDSCHVEKKIRADSDVIVSGDIYRRICMLQLFFDFVFIFIYHYLRPWDWLRDFLRFFKKSHANRN